MDVDKTWEDYFIEGTNVLKNKLGIQNKQELQQKETDITFSKLVELYETPIIGNFDKDHLCQIHKYLFGDIYSFAGEYRKVYMFKGNSYFSGIDDIEWKLDYVLEEMNQKILEVHSKEQYAEFLAGYYNDLIAIHPFREGNGRTIREFLREFVQARTPDMQLNWSNVDKKNLLLGIQNAFVSKEQLTQEFMKALEPIAKEQENKRF